MDSNGKFVLTSYFLIILLIFGIISVFISHKLINVHNAPSIVETQLGGFLSSSLLGSRDQLNHKNQFEVIRNEPDHRLAGLSCEKLGGPKDAEEMVYWKDISSDADFVSPFQKSTTQYLTFESDRGGWNNIRMAMETLLATSFAMGRTLVLPPIHFLEQDLFKRGGDKQRDTFSYEDFFHLDSISQEHIGFNIISMEEFLQEFMKGKFQDPSTKNTIFPPNNRTDWNGVSDHELRILKAWLRESSTLLRWHPDDCMAAFPSSTDPEAMQELVTIHEELKQEEWYPKQNFQSYIGNPTPVDAFPKDRMRENWAERTRLCLYDKKLQRAPWVHFPVSKTTKLKSRMLVHFYSFLFFADWKADLWTKRFVRDHVRYTDEIQCAAARVVSAIRHKHNSVFDSIHVRRGDFQYYFEPTWVDIDHIYEMVSKQVPPNATLYIATDERDKSFFNLLKDHYQVLFLDDFTEDLGGINTNYYGMIDQLIASRGRVFFGCWFSTFTGYINRIRGYHADDHGTPGYEMGVIPSYYYALKQHYEILQKFWPVKKSFYAREFATSWRLIDTGVKVGDS